MAAAVGSTAAAVVDSMAVVVAMAAVDTGKLI